MSETRRETREREASALASEILTLARNTLLLELRYFQRALFQLKSVQTDAICFGSDGRQLAYEPWYLLARYREERGAVTRDLLHTVLHCVFRHGFVGREIDRARWDLACDVAVENVVQGLDVPCAAAAREKEQLALLQRLRGELGVLTAERVYQWLGRQAPDEQRLAALREPFWGDAHGLWYGDFDADARRAQELDAEKLWEDISRRMQTELETLRRDRESDLVQNLRALHRAKRSYAAFLRRFGVRGEALRLSDEEFDQNYYSYGLALYGNLPLIEPLETREQRRIRELVVAIDTSGSVRGDVVQSFIQHTHDILCREESFFARTRLHILQCDERIQDDALITSQEDFRRYLRTLQIRGLGQTDFRPVFAYVDELLRKKELTELRGLLYFTDGRGTFPARKPPYETAFILHRDDYEEPPVPPWALRLVLTEDEILDERFGD